MIRFRLLAISALALSAFCAGCDGKKEERPAAVAQPNEQLSYAQLPKDAVLVAVDGEPFTKGDMEERIGLRLTLAQLRRRSVVKNAEMIRSELLRTGISKFVNDVVLAKAGRRANAEIDSAERDRLLDKIARNYAGKADFARLKRSVSVSERKLLEDEAERQILTKRGEEALIAANLEPVAGDEVAKRRAYFTEYNKRVAAVLERTYANASNIWKRLESGETFEHLANWVEEQGLERINVDREPTVLRVIDYRDDKAYYDVLTKTPNGGLVPPFEGDNGLLVVKKVGAGTSRESDGREGFDTVSVLRVFLDLPAGWEPQTDEELLQDVNTIHRRKALEKGFNALLKETKVEYPSGTNLFTRAGSAFSPRAALPREVRRRIPRGVRLPK